MVTFVCQYCDLTLKKKQCDTHVLGRCRPAALICIDCSKTFRGMQYKSHISCISQMDKHWGQYAPSKMKNGNQNNHVNTKKQESKEIQSNLTEKKEQRQQQSSKDWKGWKNQIKKAIVQQNPEQKKVQLQDLKKVVLKRYHEEFQRTDKDEQLFLQKLQKLKKIKLVTYVSLN